MQGSKKKSKTGLIIGLSIGGVALVALAVIIGLVVGEMFRDSLNDSYPWSDPAIFTPGPVQTAPPVPVDPDPAPETTPPPPSMVNSALIGRWALDQGDYIWFFGDAGFIEFTREDNGRFGVYESEYDEEGTWYLNDAGNLIVDGIWTGVQEFRFVLDGDRLTLIDSDGDTAIYSRVG